MRRRWIVAMVLFIGSGCGREPASKVQIKAPGVEVNVDKKTGKVDVVAPGADVHVNPK